MEVTAAPRGRAAPTTEKKEDDETSKKSAKKRRRSKSPVLSPGHVTIDITGPDDDVIVITEDTPQLNWPVERQMTEPEMEEFAAAKEEAEKKLRSYWDRGLESDDTIDRIRKGEKYNMDKRKELP